MKNITIPFEIPSDILIALNETEQEFKMHLHANTAASLFQEGKLTLGKAIQLSGMNRYEFEIYLAKKAIPISNLSYDEIMSDVDKLKNI